MICIGVDAGGTSTHVALSENGAFARETRAAAANVTTIGVDAAAAIITAAMRELLAGARPNAISVGAAGAGRKTIADGLRELIAAAFPQARLSVGDDATIALRAAIPQGDGAVLIAGTGSVAYAVHGERAERRGGLGYLAGDEGSAFW
ncbi:MAG TPA: BadF/BadG/BcrA/BcrD ATPase family protein, partial [Candidatus Elarobacter sp.]|nr:BadF/BadG/BcrA/BcrD ATPase family protein [Candidatus Elarobacter sp.]